MLHPPVEFGQYASAQITAFATANGITRSMHYTGVRWDNAMAGSFFATLTTEFYDRRRRNALFGQISPVNFELQYSNQNAELHDAAQPSVHQPVQI